MEIEVVNSLLNTLEEIRRKTTDNAEVSGVSRAIAEIQQCCTQDLERTLKSTRDELFHHKGPLYDSFDNSEEVCALRSTAYEAAKQAINHVIKVRQATVAANERPHS